VGLGPPVGRLDEIELLGELVSSPGGLPPVYVMQSHDIDSAAMGWRAALAQWTYDNFELLRRHPWILELPITGPPLGPKQLTCLESGLRCLEATSLPEPEKAGVIQLLAGYALSEARLSADVGPADPEASGPAAAGQTYGGMLRQLLSVERFPALTAAVAAGAFDDPAGYTDADFDFWLQRTLDGVEAFIMTRTKRPARPRR